MDFAQTLMDAWISGMITGFKILIQSAIQSGTIFIFLGVAILGRIVKWYRAITQ